MATSLLEPTPALQAAQRTRRGALRLTIPGIILVLASLLPFLNKAYTNDDPFFLLEARQILKTPLQPMSFPICWTVGGETCVAKASNLGPLSAQAFMGYVLAPIMLAGGAEWMAHLLQILLACLAVLEMVRLTLRLGFDRVQAAAAGLMLAAVPPFLPMASTAMPDMAALALGLTGMERLLAWKRDRLPNQALMASLALGLAGFARPHLALLLPLGALWLFDEFPMQKALRQFRREAYLWAPIMAAGCILAAVNLVTRDHGRQVESANLLAGFSRAPRNLFAYALYLSFPIPFAAVWLAMNWRKTPLLLLLPAIPVVMFHFLLFPSTSLVQEWPAAASFYGVAALIHMFSQYVRARDRVGVLLGLWMLIPAPVCIYMQLPIKYLLAVIPAVVLILLRSLETLPKRRELSAYGALAVLCGAYSGLLLKADADFAEYGRRAAAELIAPHVASGERVWYGGVMGFYWYAQEAGARISKPGEPGPNPGDLLAVGLMEFGGATRDRFPSRELIESRSYDSPHGRTMGYGGALYSNNFGYALWVWNPKATNDYELCRIR